MSKQTVLILGATGKTGSSIVDGLLESDNFNVIAGVRPSSASKPEVESLKTRGVQIRVLDIEHWTAEQLVEPLKGVDTVISAILFENVPLQKRLVDACKLLGVKRFVPDDWATACVRGLRDMHDMKLNIHEYVKKVGLGYTFIDIGWWMELTLPRQDSPDILRTRFGTGDVKNAVTDRKDIGKFVARIVADERTLNQYVFAYTEEVTQNEAIALAERVSGRKFDIKTIGEDELVEMAKDSKYGVLQHVFQYAYSIWIRGDNTVENAKKEEYGGALDARELYPDIAKELTSLEEFAKKLYGVSDK